MKRRLGSKIQKGILNCLNDKGITYDYGFGGRNTSQVIDYLFEKKIIKRPDRRRKDYQKKYNSIYQSVCRAIRNLARDEPEKGIKPVFRVEKTPTGFTQKWSYSFRVDRNRRATIEDRYPIWVQWILPMDLELFEYEEELQPFWCNWCKKDVKTTSFEEHLEKYHNMNLEKYRKTFKS